MTPSKDTAPKALLSPSARLALGVLLAIYLVLVSLYTLKTPPLESPDAYYHFGVIEHMARTGQHPPRENPEDYAWTHAVFHAPFYYMVSGLAISAIDTSDFPQQWPRNPHARIGLPHSLNNHNFVSIMTQPWTQSYLAVYVVRAISILCGAVTLASIFMIARLLVPGKLLFAGLSGAFVLFNPQFLYISAVINNDNMVVALSLVSLALMIYMVKYRYSWQLVLMLSIVMALGTISKVNAMPLYPVIGFALLYIVWRDKLGFWRLVQWVGIISVVWFALAGWWFAWNWLTLGDFTATERLAEVAGGASGVPTGLDALWDEFVGVYYSFWGLFGWFNIIAPQQFYDYVSLILAVGLLGLAWALLRHPANRDNRVIVALLLAHALLVFIGLWRFRGMVQAAQGRMLFSFLAVVACGLAYGLLTYRFRLIPIVLIGGLALPALLFPFTLLDPAFRKPAQLDEIPDSANLVDVRFGPVVLRGYDIDDDPVDYWEYQTPADRDLVEITLYWQPIERTDIPLSMFVQVYAPDDSPGSDFAPVEVGKVDSYPGRGMMRTDTWDTGYVYADTYYLELQGDFALTPYEPRFRVGLRDNETDTYIQATTIGGDPIPPVVPRGGTVFSRERPCEALPNLAQPLAVGFQDLATLQGYTLATTETQPGVNFDLRLLWQIENTTPDDFAVFVQLIDPNQPEILVGSGDAAPRSNWYPTSAWVPGVCFTDRYTVRVSPDAEPGEYRLYVGLYHIADGWRLQAATDAAEGQANIFADGYILDETVTVR